MANWKKASNNLISSSQKSRAPKNTARAFVKRVQNRLQKTGLLASKKHILVAVSGGPDSMALLHTLYTLHKKCDWQLAVAHVNYHLRGKDSNRDTLLVQTTAQELGLPFYLLEKKSSAGASEDSLRTVRYAFFEKLAAKHGFDAVALAHHQNDQAETVLLRLLRGSGSLGLSGMRELRGLYVRPFLTIPKQEILSFVENQNIPYRLDKSNQENTYLRNKVRNTLLPLLATYNPNIVKTLATTAETLQKELIHQNKLVPFPITKKKNRISFSRTRFASYRKGEQISFLRTVFQEAGLAVPSKSLAETLITTVASTPKKGLNKEYSRLKLTVNNDMIDIHFKELD